MRANKKSYSAEYQKGVFKESQNKNHRVFCKATMLDQRLVHKWRAKYGNRTKQTEREMLRSAS